MVQRAPIIDEHVNRRVIEEVQPVLYREVVQPVVVEQVKPIYETVRDAPQYVNEQRPMRDLGTRMLGQQQQQQQFGPQWQQQQQPLSASRGFPQQQGTGLQGLPPRIVQPSANLLGMNSGQRSLNNQGSSLGNVIRMEYEVKGFNNQHQQICDPYVERSVIREVPASQLNPCSGQGSIGQRDWNQQGFSGRDYDQGFSHGQQRGWTQGQQGSIGQRDWNQRQQGFSGRDYDQDWDQDQSFIGQQGSFGQRDWNQGSFGRDYDHDQEFSGRSWNQGQQRFSGRDYDQGLIGQREYNQNLGQQGYSRQNWNQPSVSDANLISTRGSSYGQNWSQGQRLGNPWDQGYSQQGFSQQQNWNQTGQPSFGQLIERQALNFSQRQHQAGNSYSEY